MRTRWKILSSVIAAVMVLSSLSAIVLADEYLPGDGFKYKLNDNVLTVKCTSDYVNLLRVNELRENTDIEEIIFDLSDIEADHGCYDVSLIGAHEGPSPLSNVSEIELICDEERSFDFLEIRGFAVQDDDSIIISSKIQINELYISSMSIDSFAFLDDVNVNFVRFNNCNQFTSVDLSGYSDIHISFFNCSELSSVVFPEGVTTIEYGMFQSCKKLKSIEIPDTVQTILPWAFGVSGITSVEIPEGVTCINHNVFNSCYYLESVSIPGSVSSIDMSSFMDCRSLKDVYFSGTETQWDNIELTNDRNLENTGYETVTDLFPHAEIHFADDLPTGWVLIDGSWHLYDSDGKMLTGWQQDGGKWYFLAENGDMRIGWQNSGNKWYYLDPDTGAMKTGWLKDGGKWYFLKSNGEMATGWTFTDTQYNFFDESGAMKTGWLVYDGSWYYWDSNGLVVEGWLKDGGKWYYLYPELAYEWQTIDGVKYFFDSSTGAMVTGWKKIGGEWYYFESSGAMKTGWLNDNGTWYFLKNDGTMAAGEYCKGYWINEDATWTYPYKFQWKQDSKGWYYIASNGWYVKNETVTIDGVEYEFDSAGYIKE